MLRDAPLDQREDRVLLRGDQTRMAVSRREIVRQMQRMQDEMSRLVERVVVAVTECKSGRTETARAEADEIDDRGKFAGHDETMCREAAQYKAVHTANRIADVPAGKPPYNGRMNRPGSSGRVSATTLILIAAIAAALGLWFGTRTFGPATPPHLETAVLYPVARALPAFQLTQSNGKPLTLADWKGHWTVAYFGYTNCPDVCPTTLAAFKQAWKSLDAAGVGNAIRFDFISVDPARDTPEVLARYVGFFDKDFIAATGTDEELTRLTRALGLVYSIEKTSDSNYAVDHSAAVVIIDPDGHQIGLFRPPFEPAKIAADLQTLVARKR